VSETHSSTVPACTGVQQFFPVIQERCRPVHVGKQRQGLWSSHLPASVVCEWHASGTARPCR